MGYVTIKEESEDVLQLTREPRQKAWAIFIGCTSLGLGAACFCNDSLTMKILYVVGALIVGVSCFETWDECVIDKKEKRVKIKSQNLCQRFLPFVNQNFVSAELDELVDVIVRQEEVKYAGTGHMVALVFESGFQLGVTEYATLGDKSEHEAVAEKIYKFTELEKKAREFVDDIEVLGDDDDTDNDDSEETAEFIVTKVAPVDCVTVTPDTQGEVGNVRVELTSNTTQSTPIDETKEESSPQEPVISAPQDPISDMIQEPSGDSSETPNGSQPDQESSASDDSFEKIDESAVKDFME